jgi:hypothetical protein
LIVCDKNSTYLPSNRAFRGDLRQRRHTTALFADRRLYYAAHIVMGLHYSAFLMLYLISAAALPGGDSRTGRCPISG